MSDPCYICGTDTSIREHGVGCPNHPDERRKPPTPPPSRPQGEIPDDEALARIVADGLPGTIDGQRWVGGIVDDLIAAGFTRGRRDGEGWIACAERMPEDGACVLVAGRAMEVGHPTATFIERRINEHTDEPRTEHYWATTAGPLHLSYVTAWRPLPAPPDNQARGEGGG